METGQHHACHAVGQVVGKILKEHLSMVTSTGSVTGRNRLVTEMSFYGKSSAAHYCFLAVVQRLTR